MRLSKTPPLPPPKSGDWRAQGTISKNRFRIFATLYSMTPSTFHFRRLVLNTGTTTSRRYTPSWLSHRLLLKLCEQPGHLRLPYPMQGYGMAIAPGSDERGGSFTLYLERATTSWQFAECAYCTDEASSSSRFADLVDTYRAAVQAGQATLLADGFRQPRGVPWLGYLQWNCDVPVPAEVHGFDRRASASRL